MIRKLILLSFLTMLTALSASAYDFEYNGIYYNITDASSRKVEVTYKDTNYNSYSGSVSIPMSVTYNGYTYSVTAIGNDAFTQSTGLTSVTIPVSVSVMNANAFLHCSGLTSVNISNLGAWCSIAFVGNAYSNPLTWARHLYLNGTEVTELTVPDGGAQLGSFQFYRCEGLTSVTLPNSVTSLGWSCFNGCSNLTTVTLGRGLTSLDRYVFGNCPALTSVTCLATTPPTIDYESFDSSTYSNATLYVPNGSKSAYEAADNWSNFATIEELPYSFVVNGIYYAITGTSPNTVEVTYKDTNYNTYSGSVSIPSRVAYNGATYSVTAIGASAFRKSTNLTSLTIPTSITSSGASAFNQCNSLTRVNISNLKAWCNISFINNADANPLTWAHHLYLSGTEVTELTVPDGVTQLGAFQFYKCEGLTSVTLPNSVTSLGWSCFSACPNLSTVTLGSGMTSISNYAFYNCPALTSVTCLATTPPTMATRDVFDSDVYSNATLHVPKGYKSAYQAADYWSNFTNIQEPAYDFVVNGIYYAITGTSPNTVEVTYKDTNYNTYSGDVVIPGSVTYNGTTYSVTAIASNAFRSSSGLTSVTIPPTVTTSGASAFQACSGLTRVNISNLAAWCNITFVSDSYSSPLFYARHLYLNGTEVTDLKVPDGVTQLGSFLFDRCEGLTSVTIPNSVTTIGWSCFNSCPNLTTVTLGNGLTNIRNYAFYNCPALSSIKILATTPPTMASSEVFDSDVYSNATLTVPKGCKSAYQAATHWSNFANIRECNYDFEKGGFYYNIIGASQVEVTYKDTNFNTYSGDVTIPSSVTYEGTNYIVYGIGDNAFDDCFGLTSVTIPNTVTYLGFLAFNKCTSLTSVTIPNSVTSMSGLVFFKCTGLTHVVLGTNCRFLTVDGNYPANIFKGCPNITEIKNLSMDAWSYYESSTAPVFEQTVYDHAKLYVPKGCLNDYAATNYWSRFANIFELPYTFEKDGIYYWKTGADSVMVSYKSTEGYEGFNGDYHGDVVIPSTVTYNGVTYNVLAISDYAFQGCTDLTSVIIPNSVKYICQCAFDGCTALTSVTIPNSVAEIYNWAFSCCSSLKTLTIGSGTTFISYLAFAECDSLTAVTCLAETPPNTIYGIFSEMAFVNATLFVPSGSVSAYQATANWNGFYSIKPHLDYALNDEGASIHFTSTGNYPWTNVINEGRTYVMSGNKGVHSCISSLMTTVDVGSGASVSFDFKAWGEGAHWDVCEFVIDEVIQFSYGNRDNDWETFTVELAPGSHMLEWRYIKDYSLNGPGDYFAVDNVKVTGLMTVVTGDINGDNVVNIADVTSLIDLLVSSGSTGNPGADVNGDGAVNIADVTALIDYLLNGVW